MRTVVVRLGAVLATAIVAVAALGTPAWAHNELIGSDPAEGSTVTSAITTVTLTFAQPIPAQDTTVAVIGPDGVSYSTGPSGRTPVAPGRDHRAVADDLPRRRPRAGRVRIHQRLCGTHADPAAADHTASD
jgi:hypothetical protein